MLSPSLRSRVNSAKLAAGGLFAIENKQKLIPVAAPTARDDIVVAPFSSLPRVAGV
jgi:hypothetical protein